MPSVLGVLVEVGVELVAVEPPVGGGETLLGRLAGAWGACVGDPAGQVGVGLPCGAEGDACGGVSPGPVGADDDGSALFLALMSAILWAPVLGTFLGFPANAANISLCLSSSISCWTLNLSASFSSLSLASFVKCFSMRVQALSILLSALFSGVVWLTWW